MFDCFEFLLDLLFSPVMSFADQLKSVRLRSTNQPKEKTNEPLLCPDSETYRKMMDETQFECYYDKIQPWTFPSAIFSINQEEINALRDGHFCFTNLPFENDDKKTEECFQRYPLLRKLADQIDACPLSRPIFVRLSTRSPKDAVLLLDKNKFRTLFHQALTSIKSADTSGLIVTFSLYFSSDIF